MLQIYLEHKAVDLPFVDYGHLYLVLRDNDPLVLASGNVIRGDSTGIFNLTTAESGGTLVGSGDEHPQGDPPPIARTRTLRG